MAGFIPIGGMGMGGGGGGGFDLGPPQNVFTGADRAAAESARDTYFTANPSNLAEYNTDTNLNIRLEYTDGSDQVVQYQTRNAAGTTWVDNQSVRAVQGPPGQDGAPGMGIPVDPGVRDMDLLLFSSAGGGTLMRAPARMESGTGNLIVTATESEFEADAMSMTPGTRMGFSSSFQNYRIDQFPTIKFTPPDAAHRRDGPSFEMRYFHLTEAENDFPIQEVQTEPLSSFPLSFPYTATLNSRINSVKFQVGTAMTNVRVFVRYNDGEQAPIRYIPSREAWISGTGGLDLDVGEQTIDFGESELFLFADQPGGPNVVNVEIRADSGSLLGDTNDFPALTAVIQRGVFRNLVFEQQLTPRIRSFDISSVVDKTPLAPFTLSGPQTFTFQVDNPQTARDITIRQGAATIATLTTDQLASGTVTTTVTTQTLTNPGNEIIFTLRMEDVNGVLITDTVRIRIPEEHELAYYGTEDAVADFNTVDVSTLTSADVTQAGSSFQVVQSVPNTEFLGILVPSNRPATSIVDDATGQAAYTPTGSAANTITRVQNVRSIGGIQYDLYHIQNNSGFTGPFSLTVTVGG